MGCMNKNTLCGLNFVIFLLGGGVVGVASVAIMQASWYGVLLSERVLTLLVIFLLAGLVSALLSSLGCTGAMKENSCILKTYALIGMILVIVQIVLGIVMFVYAEEMAINGVKAAMSQYGSGNSAFDELVDTAFHDEQCCGIWDYEDWQNFNYTGIADGCCTQVTKGCGVDYFSNPDREDRPGIWGGGCWYRAKNIIGPLGIVLGALAFGIAIIQLIGISCACVIANKSRRYI